MQSWSPELRGTSYSGELIAVAKNPAGVSCKDTIMKPRVARNELLWGADRGGKKPRSSILQGYGLGAQSCEERATLGADRGGKKPRRGFGSPHAHTQHSSQGPQVGVQPRPRGGLAQERTAILRRAGRVRCGRRL
jgi:hypothetical protein